MREGFITGITIRLKNILPLLSLLLLIVATSADASIVFSQDPVNHAASRISDWSDDKQKATNFILVSGPCVITKITWWGSYGANPNPAVDSFVFKFFEEDLFNPGFPSTACLNDGTRYPKSYTGADFTRTATTMVSDPSGRTIYAYSAILDKPIVLAGNKKYWLAITNSTPSYGYPSLPNSKWGWVESISGYQWYRMGHCDLCADDWSVSNTKSFAFAIEALPDIVGFKSVANGTLVSGIDGFVTAAFTDFFYIRTSDRTSGIRVKSTGHTLTAGNKVHIVGRIDTNTDSERYIDASSAVKIVGSGTTLPLHMSIKSLGGTPFGLQSGVKDGVGLNNIGLLVRVSGTIKSIDTSTQKSWFTIDDGSGVVKVIVSAGTVIPDVGHYIAVSGVSSCEKSGSDILYVLRATKGETIKIIK